MSTPTIKAGPRLPDFPVVVIHAEDPPGSGLAACCGLPWRKDPVGRLGQTYWMCTGCMNAGRPRQWRTAALTALREWVEGMLDEDNFATYPGIGTSQDAYAAVLAEIDRRLAQ